MADTPKDVPERLHLKRVKLSESQRLEFKMTEQPSGLRPALTPEEEARLREGAETALSRPQPQYTSRTKPVTFTDPKTGAVGESQTFKAFRPETLDLLRALQIRMKQLKEHTRLELEAQWEKDLNNRAVKILAAKDDGAADYTYMPQTVEDEDELLDMLQTQLADVENALISEEYARTSSHVVALEQQLLAYRVNGTFQALHPGRDGALQQATVDTLRVAKSYCWSPQCVEAVAGAAERLAPEVMPGELPLGEVIQPEASGWWWFEKPLPIKTTSSGEAAVALLWRRELREGWIGDALDGEGPRPPSAVDLALLGPRKRPVVSLTWFNVFILESVSLNGRAILAPSPTLAWTWVDTVPLSKLEANMRQRYGEVERARKGGMQALDAEGCAAASLWFSKFWMAAGTYLDSRVTASGKQRPPLMGTVTTKLPRQQGRQLQRQFLLKQFPTVEVVYLRRTEPKEPLSNKPQVKEHDHCWWVEAFPRRQWFPSLGRHELIMVTEHIRGPRDRPLKQTRRVYSVSR